MSFIISIYARLISWYGKRVVIGALVLTAALILSGVYLNVRGGVDEGVALETAKRIVSVEAVGAIGSPSGSLSVLGQVESTREARLVTEAGGRVTSVSVTLGDVVRAGTVLATIENSRERAVVLQAQGSYEAAVAGQTSGDASLKSAERAAEEAKTSALNAYRAALTASDNVLNNTIDQLFADADGALPGVLIDAGGRAPELSRERVALGEIMTTWKVDALNANTGSARLLDDAERNATRLGDLLSTLATLYASDENVPPSLASFGPSISAARGQIDGVLASLSGARSSLIASDNALTQARIAGESGQASASDAQVKQALGSLRLAQANLEKTIIRSPIAGTVQSITVKEGSTVPQGSPAAIVSSEGALEVVAYVTESDSRIITVGTEALVEGSVRGVVTAIASAVDPVTKKIELRVGVDGSESVLTNGQAVTMSLITDVASDTMSAAMLPIISLKMTPDGAIVFTVVDGKLVAHKVELGAIRGDRVSIEGGLDSTWSIVTDARGLRAGEEVVVQ